MRIFCKKGEIYYADLGVGVGCEQEGKRPVLIIQNDKGNLYSNTTIIAPITSKNKTKLPTHVDILLDEPSIVLCEQIRVIDKNRLINKVQDINNVEMENVEKAIRISLGL